jgi:hypothetical protein
VRTEPQGRKARLMTDVTNITFGKEEVAISLQAIRPPLGNDSGISKYMAAVTV